ncbi:MAG: nucleotidyl transferase AbiEii/AbiGii toxin family protein [Gemmatimonadota bacterium]
MTASDLLRLLVSRLEDAEVRYALGGSIASMVYGEPRATLDIDVVVTLDASTAERIVEAFPAPEFYLHAERVAAVAERGGTFNAIHPASGFKIDFFVASDPIEERQLAGRMRQVVLPGVSGWCSPPEELIAKKLEYFRAGESTKHLRDIRSMLEISPESIDLEQVEALVREFHLEDAWRKVRGE